MDILIFILLGVMPALVITAGLSDLITMRIPNWISASLILTFFPAALASGLSIVQIGIHVGVGLAALFAGMAMFAMRWVGGGDAKLMAAVCLWLGLTGSGVFLLWTGVLGGLFCLMLMFARAYAAPFIAGIPGWVGQLMEPKGDIPYGVAIAAGALMAYPASALMAGAVG